MTVLHVANSVGVGLRLRLVVVDEYQFVLCVKHALWGSGIARFRHWQPLDLLAFLVHRKVAGLATVSGEPFTSAEPVWPNGAYEHRIPIKFSLVLLPENRPDDTLIRQSLNKTWGHRSGVYLGAQRLLENSSAEIVLQTLEGRGDNPTVVSEYLDEYLKRNSHVWKFPPRAREK